MKVGDRVKYNYAGKEIYGEIIYIEDAGGKGTLVNFEDGKIKHFHNASFHWDKKWFPEKLKKEDIRTMYWVDLCDLVEIQETAEEINQRYLSEMDK